MSSDNQTGGLQVEYTACEVCGDEPDAGFVPTYVYSLAPEDRDEETVTTYPVRESFSKPFACSAECFQSFVDANPEVR